MPAPGDDCQALQRSLESDEARKWLRHQLGEDVLRKNSKRQISSYSLKATLFSLAAKRELKHEDRLAMGHTHPFRMADVYPEKLFFCSNVADSAKARFLALYNNVNERVQSCTIEVADSHRKKAA